MASKDLVPFHFKPGQSGNPKGRPKGSRNVSAALRELMEKQIVVPKHIRALVNLGSKDKMTGAEILALAIYARAVKANDKAADMVLDRTEGKVTQPISGVEFEQNIDFGDVSDEVMKSVLERLRGKIKPG